ncbi:hypothetical protein [Arthrobacter sp. JZ12]|uniref:hypothetical protein n=1 Tax=Arthrobacter sp. JZ12 TaxID=2654190 RepID=UPI002B47E538|nr:hypothetical protein [Arthrobacter sp. JZ12]
MSQSPDHKHNDDHSLSPKGQRKVSNLMITGIVVVIAAVLIFVVASAIMNGM